ncbi:MAG: DUF58 domain-containing protein [Candidatus Gracilibacteria bacterium]|nr:DUF58 domain-containing protein [Candidatus Gracilibacteria bacterium]
MNTYKKIKTFELKFKKNLGSNLFGAYKSAFIGSGIEFSEIKQYAYGENIKNIDWKTTAKKGELYTKKYEEERDLNVIFVLDISKSMNFGSKDITKKQLQEEIFYTLGLSAIENDDNVGAIIYDEEIKEFIFPKKGFGNLYKILEKLEQNGTKNKNTINILKEIIKRHIKKSLIFILTDDEKIDDEKVLKIASKENQIIIINIFDFFENNLFLNNSNLALNLDKSSININLDKQKITEFVNLRKENLENFKNKLQKNHIGYLYIDTNMNFYNELRQYFYKIS